MDQEFFCSDQFNSLHIRSAPEGLVTIGPCCNTRGQNIPPSTFDYNTNPYLFEIRQAAQANQRAKACSNCWNHEDAGGFSRRLNGRSDPSVYRGVVLERLDYTTQNICNLACVHCSSYSSNLWAKLNGESDDNASYHDKVDMLSRVDLSKVYYLHFTGGEPLMTREHLKVLDLVHAAKGLESITRCSYNTNVTFFPDEEVLRRWRLMRSINLVCSIDAVGPAAQILRWPCDWQQVDQNMRKLVELSREMPQIEVTLNITVANYNFLELGDIIDWINGIDPDIFLNWQLVNQDFMHPSSLPVRAWEQAIEITNKHPGLKEWTRSFQDQSLRNQLSWQQTVSWLDKMDRQRNHTWRGVLKIGSLV